MNKSEHIKYWTDSSEDDLKAMNNLFKSKDYVWSLFLGHLVIEKLLKAIAVKNDVDSVPKVHDLNKIAKKANLAIDSEMEDLLDVITTFNIEARYPDYKREFYKRCTKEFASEYNDKIRNLRLWLLEQIKI